MFAFLLVAQLSATVACTTPDPGAGFVCAPNGQWLPPGHPLLPPAEAAPAPDCDPRPNPYTEPDRAAACTAWEAQHAPRPALPTFVVGSVYADPYSAVRIYVLAVTRSLEGVPVVTAQRVQPADGVVFSFRTDAPQAQQWRVVP